MPAKGRPALADVRPMLATLADAPLDDPGLVYEPKYDGIRALVAVVPAKGKPVVTISSRAGNDKTAQFPEIVEAFQKWWPADAGAALLDGEIVALDPDGVPRSFGHIQERIHLVAERDVARRAATQPVAFIAFDVLFAGGKDLCALPLDERRVHLEAVMRGVPAAVLRLARQVRGDGTALMAEAQAESWEGLVAKDARSPYRPGKRSAEWRKLKLVKRQELVVGGWTAPRGSRHRFGSLILGVPGNDGGVLKYVGHVGGGFSQEALRAIGARLDALAQKTCPFDAVPPSNETPHWVRPELVAEVRFSEWTQDGHLRHPIFLGLRDDVTAESVRVEGQPPRPDPVPAKRGMGRGEGSATVDLPRETQLLLDALTEIESRNSGRLRLANGDVLELGNLQKVLWPELGITKGELLRYYATIAPQLLPVVNDRPLVMRRFPDGIARAAFYQHRAPDDVPAGVRAEPVPGDTDVPARLIGGSLTTLLYMTQLAVLSQDPFFSRVQSPSIMDFAAIDLDPMDGATFERVLDVARWVRDELEALGVTAFPKTSGASGLHVFIPLPPRTPYEAGRLFCQIVGEIVAKKHPKEATVERTVGKRDPTSVYVDCLQNIEGKTLACAYSARASDYGGASTPLTWAEVDAGFDRRDFTMRTLPARVREVGDLWEGLRTSPGIDLTAALDRVQKRHGG